VKIEQALQAGENLKAGLLKPDQKYLEVQMLELVIGKDADD
jgi:hypothetical protein